MIGRWILTPGATAATPFTSFSPCLTGLLPWPCAAQSGKCLQRRFQGHEAVFAIHEDKKHPHAHVVVKMFNVETEKKLRLNRPDLYRLREIFAEAAREEGR